MKQTFMNISKEKRQFIIDNTIEIFAQSGYELTSTNHIVKTLNISKGSLFKYFESKLDLFMYLVNYSTKQLEEYLDNLRLVNTDNLRDRLLKYAAYEFDFLCEQPAVYQFFYRLIKDFQHPELVNVRSKLIEESSRYQKKLVKKLLLEDVKEGCEEYKKYIFFMNHIFYIIQGYNETFLDIVNSSEEFIKLKDGYISGLRKHFDLVRWYDE